MKHLEKDLNKTVAFVLIVVFILFSFTFVLAPIYNSISRITGLNGKINLAKTSPKTNPAPDLQPSITMQFVTTAHANLPWDFYPKQNSIMLHPGKNTQMLFFMKNNTNKTMTVQAIPSITPWQAAPHIRKVEDFYFSQQTLGPGESVNLPVVFHIDDKLPHDIETITLAYALFEVELRQGKIP